MKKIISYFTPLLVSLFLFPIIVKADTYNVSVNSQDFDYVSSSSDFVKFKALIDDYISNNSNYNYYIIFYNEDFDSNDNPYYSTSYSNLQARLYSSIPTVNFIQYTNRFNMHLSGTGARVTTNSTITQLFVGSSFPNLYININYPNNSIMLLAYLDSNFDITYLLPQDLQINSSYYSYHLEQNTTFYSLYYLYTHENIPPDNTPLLTQFFDISLEKLSLICDFFVSSYIYLAIFVIFIIYFSILLLRRLK